MKLKKPVALCYPRRTPFAQIGKALGHLEGHQLGQVVAEDLLKTSKITKDKIEGIIVGEGFSAAPNAARVVANLIGLRDEIPALSVANNCVSGMEAIVEAARRVSLGEGKLFLVLGEESQTAMPFVVKRARLDKKSATLDKLKELLPDNLPEGVEIRDTLEDGLGDSETSYAMQVTAEILAQNYALPRALCDEFAYESFKRSYEATLGGQYKKYIIAMKDSEGSDIDADEAVLLRKGIVENPSRMERAMLMFENPQAKFEDFKTKYARDLKKTHGPTLSIFNASPRSDGAAGLFVVDLDYARELGLEIAGVLTGWRMKGVNPNLMGLGQAEATLGLLEDMQLSMKDVDMIEIHEAFAATAVAALEEIKNRSGFDWHSAFKNKKINPNGGSIAIGHPFGATGVRLAANAAMDLAENQGVKRVLITACAHGGVAGSLMIERA